MTKTAYTNVNLFNGIDDKIKSNTTLVVDDESGKITKIDEGIAPEADQTVDLHNKYVIPGLINCHTHIIMDPLTPDGGSESDVVSSTVRAVKHLHDLLKSGVTYIRECGSTYNIDIALNNLIKKNKLTKVPEIVPAGHPFSMTGDTAICLILVCWSIHQMKCARLFVRELKLVPKQLKSWPQVA